MRRKPLGKLNFQQFTKEWKPESLSVLLLTSVLVDALCQCTESRWLHFKLLWVRPWRTLSSKPLKMCFRFSFLLILAGLFSRQLREPNVFEDTRRHKGKVTLHLVVVFVFAFLTQRTLFPAPILTDSNTSSQSMVLVVSVALNPG